MLAPLFLLIPSCLARIDSIFHLLNLICQCSLIHYAWFLHIYSIIINRSVISSKLQFVRYSIKLSYYTHYYNTIRCLIEIESTLVPTPETPTTLHWNVLCIFLCRFYPILLRCYTLSPPGVFILHFHVHYGILSLISVWSVLRFLSLCVTLLIAFCYW